MFVFLYSFSFGLFCFEFVFFYVYFKFFLDIAVLYRSFAIVRLLFDKLEKCFFFFKSEIKQTLNVTKRQKQRRQRQREGERGREKKNVRSHNAQSKRTVFWYQWWPFDLLLIDVSFRKPNNYRIIQATNNWKQHPLDL